MGKVGKVGKVVVGGGEDGGGAGVMSCDVGDGDGMSGEGGGGGEESNQGGEENRESG